MRSRLAAGIGAAIAALVLAACGGQRNAAPSLIGGPFQMSDQNGRRVDQRLLLGKWSAVYFGYTFCPDACPTTLTALGRAQVALGRRAARFQVVFVTVDPARDTPSQLKSYLSSPAFPKGTIGLTGTPAQTAAMAKAYRVFFQRQGSDANYSVDHTSVVFLMNPKGQFDRPLDTSVAPPAIAAQIISAMQQS